MARAAVERESIPVGVFPASASEAVDFAEGPPLPEVRTAPFGAFAGDDDDGDLNSTFGADERTVSAAELIASGLVCFRGDEVLSDMAPSCARETDCPFVAATSAGPLPQSPLPTSSGFLPRTVSMARSLEAAIESSASKIGGRRAVDDDGDSDSESNAFNPTSSTASNTSDSAANRITSALRTERAAASNAALATDDLWLFTNARAGATRNLFDQRPGRRDRIEDEARICATGSVALQESDASAVSSCNVAHACEGRAIVMGERGTRR